MQRSQNCLISSKNTFVTSYPRKKCDGRFTAMGRYHIISYRIVSHRIASHRIISYHIISYHIISYHIISYHIISVILFIHKMITNTIHCYFVLIFRCFNYHQIVHLLLSSSFIIIIVKYYDFSSSSSSSSAAAAAAAAASSVNIWYYSNVVVSSQTLLCYFLLFLFFLFFSLLSPFYELPCPCFVHLFMGITILNKIAPRLSSCTCRICMVSCPSHAWSVSPRGPDAGSGTVCGTMTQISLGSAMYDDPRFGHPHCAREGRGFVVIREILDPPGVSY